MTHSARCGAALHDSEHSRVDGSSVDALRTAAAAKPGSYSRSSRWGRRWPTAGDAAAFAPLEKAAALVPSAIGDRESARADGASWPNSWVTRRGR